MSQAKGKGAKGTGTVTGKGGDGDAVRVRWERKNIVLFGLGIGSVVLGYVLLSLGDVTAAPLLLVAGYCVLIPLAFIL